MYEDGYQFYQPYVSEIPRLEPRARKLWTEWLRSEEFKGREGIEALQTLEGKFCCLGVYCEKTHVPRTDTYQVQPMYGRPGYDSKGYIPDGFEIAWLDEYRGLGPYNPRGFNGSDIIFEAVEQGGPQDVGRLHFKRGHTLPTLNDSRQFTFAQLADIIDYFL